MSHQTCTGTVRRWAAVWKPQDSKILSCPHESAAQSASIYSHSYLTNWTSEAFLSGRVWEYPPAWPKSWGCYFCGLRSQTQSTSSYQYSVHSWQGHWTDLYSESSDHWHHGVCRPLRSLFCGYSCAELDLGSQAVAQYSEIKFRFACDEKFTSLRSVPLPLPNVWAAGIVTAVYRLFPSVARFFLWLARRHCLSFLLLSGCLLTPFTGFTYCTSRWFCHQCRKTFC